MIEGLLFSMKLFLLEGAQDLVAVLPQTKSGYTATAQYHNSDDDDNESGIVLLGFFSNGGHLVVHDIYSCFE